MSTVLFLFRRVDCNDGVSSYCETLMKGMQERGDKIVIASGPVKFNEQTKLRRDAMKQFSDEWLELQTLGAVKNTLSDKAAILALMRRTHVDIIFIQGFSLLPFANVISRFSGKPVVANYHGGAASHIGTSGSIKEKFYYQFIATLFRPVKFIAMSSDTTNFFRTTCGIPESRIEQILLGVDTAVYQPPSATEKKTARQMLNISEQAFVCILCGRVSPDKGHHLAIEAIRSLQDADPTERIICLFAGSGAEAEDLKRATHQTQRDVDTFRFLGFLDKGGLTEAFWASDVALLPSKIEGFGLAIAEAMACGCVPIRTPSGGASDQIIDQKTGFIVPFDDASALAMRIRDLMDVSRRQRMSHAAAAHASAHFRQDAMIEKTVDLFRKICA